MIGRGMRAPKGGRSPVRGWAGRLRGGGPGSEEPDGNNICIRNSCRNAQKLNNLLIFMLNPNNMNLRTTTIVFAICLLIANLSMQAQDYQISSPNGAISTKIKITDKVYYALDYQGENILWYSPISMTVLQNNQEAILGANPKVKKAEERSRSELIKTVWGIRAQVEDKYNEIELKMEGDYSLIFRAYNDGVAYRFRTDFDGDIKVLSEEVSWRYLENHPLMAHVVGDFQTSYEKLYTRYKISEVVEDEFISLPLLVNAGKVKMMISEADLYEYPGLYIKRLGENNRFFLDGLFPEYPKSWEPGGWCQFNLKVTERENYLAKTEGKREFPWRVMGIAAEDKDLLDSDLIYKLSRPAAIDTEWIRPGKVAWDWWNDWNLSGVDFETGVNNKTYEYYIDFAAKNGLEYIIMDEGWSDQFDLFLQKPGIDVPHLVEYAEKKGVKIILWCVWHTLDRQMEAALDMFEEWGIAGVKVDFIDRDDQIAINYYERLARESAKRKLLVDYHGCSKPTGLHRTYPNVINYESVRGNEYNKFDKDETPQHNIDIAYTRMYVGPMDYTPGAMRNSTQGNWMMDNSNPMSYGTRCHQLGMYIVYYSPLQMLCDAPTAYERYPDILKFLSEVPVEWDETIALEGKAGEYAVMARKKGNDWYLGALTDWKEREIELDLSFLDGGEYEAKMFVDGVNAHRHAEDYQVKEQILKKGDKVKIKLKPGGGAAIQFMKQ